MSKKQIQSPRLYEQVVTQIRQRIIDGELQPGDRLLPEHALAEEFGVSRTVIREAIQSLRNQGLITVKHGSGVFVEEPSTDTILEALSTVLQFRKASLYDLHEVREILEVEIAGLAAERASEEDKTELLNELEWMGSVTESPDEYIETDLLFHTILAKATHNAIFLLLLHPLMDLLRRSRSKAISAPGAMKKSFVGHQAIYECVEAGDSAGAREAMRAHLKEVRERLDTVGAEDIVFRESL